jgi:predicted porin
MNKRFLAIAIAAGLAVSSNVMAEGAEIYGIAHAAVVMNSGDDSLDNTTVNSWASRLGVKGSEDLGGGMKAVYKMEFSVDIADAGTLGGRNQYVGISGGMGTVLLGRHDTPTKMVQGKFDVFNDTVADMVNDQDGRTAPAAGANTGIEGDIRQTSAIVYYSPKMGGMQMVALLTPGEEDGSNPANENTGIADGFSVSFTYEAGPLYVGLGVDGGDVLDDQTRLVATYGMDALTVGFLYNVTDTQASTVDEDETGMGLSVAFKMGDNAIKFQYIDVTDNAGIDGADESTMTLGYDANLSARTTAYALYRAFDELDANNFAVGIKHSF